MEIELPAKKYYTFLELAARLQCSELDLRHLVIEKQIMPSIYLPSGIYSECQIRCDEVQGVSNCWAFPIEEYGEEEADSKVIRTKLRGFHFLIFPVQISANNCEFHFASETMLWHDDSEICYGLEESCDLDNVIKNGVVMAIELARFEALHNENLKLIHVEKPLGTKERNTLMTIISVLCKVANLDLTKPAKTAGLIKNTAASMGVSIGETTIEGYIKKIPDVIAGHMK
jgi:hypothetical protein